MYLFILNVHHNYTVIFFKKVLVRHLQGVEDRSTSIFERYLIYIGSPLFEKKKCVAKLKYEFKSL